MRTRSIVSIGCLALALCACAQTPRTPAEPPVVAALPAPETVRPRFTVEASSNDTWNAVGQILVRTPGVEYDGRAQMLGLYAIRYRGEPLMVLTQALPLSDAITRSTTEVTVAPRKDPAENFDNAMALFALLEAALPAELDSVRARFAAERQAKEKAKVPKKKSKRTSKK
jgi:hypothetical protein